MVGNIATLAVNTRRWSKTKDAYGLCHTSGSARNDVCRKTHRLLISGSHGGGRGSRYQMTSAGLPSTDTRGFTWPAPPGPHIIQTVVRSSASVRISGSTRIVPCGDEPPSKFGWLVWSGGKHWCLDLGRARPPLLPSPHSNTQLSYRAVHPAYECLKKETIHEC